MCARDTHSMPKVPSSPEVYEIQTTTMCNGRCIICPHRDVWDGTNRIMSRELFRTILEQMHAPSRIIPYFNNEPFCDPSLMERIAMIRQYHPDAEIEIATNLSLFTSKVREKLKASLGDSRIEEFRISMFGFTQATYEHMMPGLSWETTMQHLYGLLSDTALRERLNDISLVMIDAPGLTSEDTKRAREFCEKHGLTFHLWGYLDRAKNVSGPSNEVENDAITGCEQDRPLKRMHILHDGRVTLCCMDWREEAIMGDLSKEGLLDVWLSERYQTAREGIYLRERNALDICRRCKLAR